MKFEKLKPGMELYDVHSYKMGNTSLRSIGVWPVRVIEVSDDRSIVASWNGNKPKRMYEAQWSKYRMKAPELERCGIMGQMRIKPRASRSARESQ